MTSPPPPPAKTPKTQIAVRLPDYQVAWLRGLHAGNITGNLIALIDWVMGRRGE